MYAHGCSTGNVVYKYKDWENNLNVNLQETNLVNYDIPTPKHAETRKIMKHI